MTHRHRTLGTAFRTVMLAASAILASCEKPKVSKVETPPPVVVEPSFPVDRRLTDQQGRSIEATICGRVDQQIFILRKSDGMEAIIPFSKLSPADFDFVTTLPFQEPPSGFSLDSNARTEEPNSWQGKKVPTLILADGKTYSQVTFSKVTPDAISITHAGGIVRIPMEELTEESRTALGYDPLKAEESRRLYLEEVAAESERAAERARLRAAEDAEIMRRGREAMLQQEKLATAKTRSFIVLSVTPDGPLVNTYTPGGLAGANANAISRITGGGGGGVISAKRGDKVLLMKGYKGKPLVDDDKFTAKYIETNETYQYVSAIGASVTVGVIEALSFESGE